MAAHKPPVLYLLLGLPGAGKTTTAEQLSELTGATHLSSDSFRLNLFEDPQFTQNEHDSLYALLDRMCEILLKHGMSVVYDANLNRYVHRQEKYALAQKTGAQVQLLWLKAPRELAKQRRLDTQHHKLVPKAESAPAMFDRIADIFEPPQADEPYIELDGTKITLTYVAERLSLQR